MFSNNRLGRWATWGYALIVKNTPIWTNTVDDMDGASRSTPMAAAPGLEA